MASTYAEDRYVTCSAAEMAKKRGMKVGIVSSVSIDHATPACFYAHTPDRNNYEDIGNQLLTSGFDYFGGGSVNWKSRKTLKTANEYKAEGAKNGYKYVDSKAAKEDDKISLADFTRKGFELLDNDKGFFMMVESGKIDWACHANDVVSSVFDMVAFDEVIGAALDFYNKHPEETLIVITGDHECGGLTLGFAATEYESTFDLLKVQNISFQEFTAKVAAWAKQASKPDFNDVMKEVTAAFGLKNETTDAEESPDYLHPSYELSDYEWGLLKKAFDISMEGKGKAAVLPEEMALYYGTYDPFTVTITHLLNNKAGIDWSTYSHTGVPVPVFAIGQGQELFNGYYDNTDVAKKIMHAGKLM
ncbi:Alkaline phosphatase 4 precursor [Bacteroidales bacterium Barb6XT]|nr:Alkaline phosphatase 4 precursor [Bacteroidales bacterium Barb6XT]